MTKIIEAKNYRNKNKKNKNKNKNKKNSFTIFCIFFVGFSFIFLGSTTLVYSQQGQQNYNQQSGKQLSQSQKTEQLSQPQKTEQLSQSQKTNNQNRNNRQISTIGFFGKISLGVGYALNFERPFSYYTPLTSNDGSYYTVVDLESFNQNRDRTFSRYVLPISVPLDLDFGFHVKRTFFLFAKTSFSNFIFRNHRVTVDSRAALSGSSTNNTTFINPNRRESFTVIDIGGGIGFHARPLIPSRLLLLSDVKVSFSIDAHYSVFLGNTTLNNTGASGLISRGEGWGVTTKIGAEFPVFRKNNIYVPLGVGFYYKYHQIRFVNTTPSNTGFLYSSVSFQRVQSSRLDMHTLGIYISASVLL